MGSARLGAQEQVVGLQVGADVPDGFAGFGVFSDAPGWGDVQVDAAGDFPRAAPDLVEFFDFEDDEKVAVAGEGFSAFFEYAVGVVVDGLFADAELLGDDCRG